ncbi:MAG: ABC transporter permease [Acidimicrobiia bacterium]
MSESSLDVPPELRPNVWRPALALIRFVGRRLLATVPLLVLVSMLAFGLLLLVPGDPAVTLAGDNPAPGQVEAVRDQLGLDDHIGVQFARWAGDAVVGDFGTSLYSKVPVDELIVSRAPATLSLAALGILFAIVFGGLLGIIGAAKQGSVIDRVVIAVATLGVAVPSFWLGLVLVINFSLDRKWFPAVGYEGITEGPVEWLRHMVLPAITVAAAPAAEIARQLRASLADTLANDYVRTARAKGLRRGPVLLKHALKNAGIPAATVIGTQFSFLLGGSVIVEQVFGIPGLGSMTVAAVLQRDLPVIQAVVLIMAVAVLVSNIVVDMSYGFFNPKVRAA